MSGRSNTATWGDYAHFFENMHLDKRFAVVPDQVQAQASDLRGSPVFSSAGLHGLMLEDRSSKPTRRALNLRPSGRR